jgi:uncharacterized membrane protein YidH (DUF202 family)
MKLNFFIRVLAFICLFLSQPFTVKSTLPMPVAQQSIGKTIEAPNTIVEKTGKRKILRALKFLKRDKNKPPLVIWAVLSGLPIIAFAFPPLMLILCLLGLISFVYGEFRYSQYLAENAQYTNSESYIKVKYYRRIGRWLFGISLLCYLGYFLLLLAFLRALS